MHQNKPTGGPKPQPEALDEGMKAKSGKERDKEKEKGKEREKDKLPQREMTRTKRVDAAVLSRKEVKSLPDQDITGTEEGMDFLELALLTVPGVKVLVSTLFQMSMLPGIKGSKTNTNAMRVVAYVLAGLDMDYKMQARKTSHAPTTTPGACR